MSATAPPVPILKRWVFAIGLLIAALPGYGAVSKVQEHRRATTMVAVEGRMTGGYREVTSRRVTSTYPNVSFRTAEGRVVVAAAADALDRGEIRAGRSIALRYDPTEPSKVHLAEAVASGPGVLPWILGLLALLVGIPSVWGLLTGRPLRLRV